MNYSIYQAKARLSEIIRLVKSRRRVIISDRGVPVAEVIPYDRDNPEKLSARIERLVKSGSVLPRKEPFQAEPLVHRPGAADRFLQHDRE
jgi:prevent-host-death family protein